LPKENQLLKVIVEGRASLKCDADSEELALLLCILNGNIRSANFLLDRRWTLQYQKKVGLQPVVLSVSRGQLVAQ
jgi:hypothetical protein